jgi:SpoVK/Ycf46/Vps4 family AAA+-type ATPase
MFSLSKIQEILRLWWKELSLTAVEEGVSKIQKDNKKAEAELRKLIRSNITLKNDGSLLAIIGSIPYSSFDNNKTPEYQTAVEDAKSTIRLKIMNVLKHEEELNGLSMENIILNEETRSSIQYIIGMLKNREKFPEYGIDFPTGALFYGPPWVGKTEVARLIAKENSWNFIQVKSSDIIHGIVWASEKAITKMFEDAQKHTLSNGVCVIFIDEAENILEDRRKWRQHSNVAHFLWQVDGFQKNRWVFIILSTNIPNNIDWAVLSRMTQKIEFHLPNLEQIQQTFKMHLLSGVQGWDIQNKFQECLNHSQESLSEIYKSLLEKGASHRDIKSICNAVKIQFMLRHVNDGSTPVQVSDIYEAIDSTFPQVKQV